MTARVVGINLSSITAIRSAHTPEEKAALELSYAQVRDLSASLLNLEWKIERKKKDLHFHLERIQKIEQAQLEKGA